MKTTRGLGFSLLGVWLILMGLAQTIHFSFLGLQPLLGILALAAGILLLLGR
jgi:hypothetical protein